MTCATLAELLPHTGAMVLLDRVADADRDRIACIATSHRRPDHPLRRDGRLDAVHAIEYAAQAAAVHGGLLGESAALRLLAAARDVRLNRARLDDLEGDLRIEAVRVAVDSRAAVYRARIESGGSEIATLRLTLVAPPAGAPGCDARW